jgi:branched-chain amino acid transport system permease protein
MTDRTTLVGLAALLAGIAVAPMVLPPIIAAEILVWSLVAVAANILIGYGGLFSFGQAALFGLGGYVGGYLLAHAAPSLVTVMLASAAAGAIGGAVMGWVCVRRAGIYFIMLTFAFNQLVYYVAYSWREVTGGEDGLAGIMRPTVLFPGSPEVNLDGPLAFYITVATVFLLSFLAILRVVSSPLGKLLVAAKENPRRAASIGYNVHRAQTLAFAISGAFTGLAGMFYAMLYWIMPIDGVHWLNSGYIVFMVLIGGTSSMFGPVIGASIFILLQDFLSTIWARWPFLFGAAIIAVVLFLRGGVIELFGRLRRPGGKARNNVADRSDPLAAGTVRSHREPGAADG